MKTPIYDFVLHYSESEKSRFHMPGHKGKGPLGVEKYDITEIGGADVLEAPTGIIAESESCATALFGTSHTFYSAEGSTLAIKAMLTLALSGKSCGERKTVIAARGAHKAFIYAAAMLDFDVVWVDSEGGSLCSAEVSPEDIRRALAENPHASAVYVTSPDYLGNISDIAEISRISHEFSVPLLVDNAHGAYLAFLEENLHPIALGADMCTDSAHKTLPVLTGGAYLHISNSASPDYLLGARSALALYASTSPSYLILSSLDLANRYIEDGYHERLAECIKKVGAVKEKIAALGITVCESEPLKIVLHASDFGYTGTEITEILSENLVECEFSDKDYTVLMVTPENTERDYERLISALSDIEVRERKNTSGEVCCFKHIRVMSIREAMLSERERIPVRESVGRIAAAPTVSCPPAIPIAVSGELITESVQKMLMLYGVEFIDVIKSRS